MSINKTVSSFITFQPHPSANFTSQTFVEAIQPKESVDAIIFDCSLDLTYAQYCRSLEYAKRFPECDLIVGLTDSEIPFTKDIIMPGPGMMIEFLEKYSKKKGIVLGKPGDGLREYIKEVYNIKTPERYIFIGDNFITDIAFGKSLGFQTLHVLSGAHSYEDMMSAPDERRPNYYANSAADFIDFFKDLE